VSVLFEKTILNGMPLNNRFVRSATWEARATEEGGCTPELLEFTVDLARGGVGLVIMGHAFVLPNGKATPRQTGIYTDDFIDELSRISPQVHCHGSKVALQISHSGVHTRHEWSHKPLVGPSPFKNLFDETAKEMTISEIKETITAYGAAARRAKQAGFDAVEIHGAHGYLVNQFLSPFWNKREDAYGGNIEHRARFLFEVYDAIRSEVGEGFPVLIKLSSGDMMENGFTIDEAVWVAENLVARGIDAIEVSGGSRYSKADHVRQGIAREDQEAYFAPRAARIKEAVDVPVILVGGIRSFKVAEQITGKGTADYVALSRPLICEPHLVSQWKSGDHSRSLCRSDNLCLEPGYQGEPIFCVVQEKKRS
jgi:2,4-dienoyl-CoA reductase-like NADH-dependent reductase (Old Yellow Enzyme family)